VFQDHFCKVKSQQRATLRNEHESMAQKRIQKKAQAYRFIRPSLDSKVGELLAGDRQAVVECAERYAGHVDGKVVVVLYRDAAL
jgi:hypothetical protein